MKLFANWSKETIQKVVTVTMFSAGAVYGITYYYTLRQLGLSREWKSEIRTHQEHIEEVKEMEATARKEARLRKQVEVFVAAHRNGMITGDPFAWVVREISLLAEDHPVSVAGIRAVGADKLGLKNQYDTFSTEIELLGGYDQIGKFLEGLENRFAAGTVRSLLLSGQADGRHRATLKFTLLVVPPEKSVGPIEKKSEQKTEEKAS